MVVDQATSQAESFQPGRVTRLGCPDDKAPQVLGDRESKVHQIPKQGLYNPKERLTGEEMGIRSVEAKRIYTVPKVPHADNERCQIVTSKRLLDRITRSQGRLLAHPRLSSQKTLSRFHIQRPGMAISRHAFWPQHRPEAVYKSDGPHDQNHGSRRNFCADLLRRYAGGCPNERALYSSHGKSTENTTLIRLGNKREQVTQAACSSLRVAGSPLRSADTYSLCNTNQLGQPPESSTISTSAIPMHKTHINAHPRPRKLARSDQYGCTSTAVKDKSTNKKVTEKGTGYSNSPLQGGKARLRQVAQHTKSPTTIGKSYSNPYHSIGRLTQRVGLPNRFSTFPRNFRSDNVLLHQYPGVAYHMVCPVSDRGKKSCNTHHVRQFGGRSGNQTRLIDGLSFSGDRRNDLAPGGDDELDTVCLPHPGSLQCARRSTQSTGYPVDRVVSSTICLQKHPEKESQIASRHVCDPSESPAPSLCLSMSRRGSYSSGCDGNTVGQLGPHIPLSPVYPDFEGFTQITELEIQNSSPTHTRDSIQTMVHDIGSLQDTVDAPLSSPSTSSSRQIGRSACSYQTTRLDVIKAAYDKKFPECQRAVTLMAAPIRGVSVNEYEKKWRAFMAYLQKHNIPFEEVSLSHVIQFLTFLFDTKNLKPRTVAQYRTALTKPLLVYFGIDIVVSDVAELLKAMCLLRPSMPTKIPAWSLKKVLTFLDNLTEPLSPVMLLRKTAFLLLLSTAYRISELSACVRDNEYCCFSGLNSLNIRPHPSFLAKNENPQRRWDFKEIKMLKLRDGSVSKLCPVTTLKQYLHNTAKVKKGLLFRMPNDLKCGLTLDKLSRHICQLIRLADPVSKISAHEVRRYSCSHSFINAMLVGDLVSVMNWSSAGTFLKSYFIQVEDLDRPVSIPITNNQE